MIQVLVIVDEEGSLAALSALGRHLRITQRLPPHLLLGDADETRLDELRRIPGVRAVLDRGVPPAVLGALSPSERVFAEAWAVSRQPKTARKGEGLSWDAPGFEPPDGPKRRK